jgi:hypothetical protein
MVGFDEHGFDVIEILELGLDLFFAGYFVLLKFVESFRPLGG